MSEILLPIGWIRDGEILTYYLYIQIILKEIPCCRGVGMDVRTAILDYQLSEKLKSELIISSNLVSELTIMTEEDVAGAAKMVSLFLEAVSAEARIAYKISMSKDFLESDGIIAKAISAVKIQDYEDVNNCIAEAISFVTNTAGKALQTLIENRLI